MNESLDDLRYEQTTLLVLTKDQTLKRH